MLWRIYKARYKRQWTQRDGLQFDIEELWKASEETTFDWWPEGSEGENLKDVCNKSLPAKGNTYAKSSWHICTKACFLEIKGAYSNLPSED